MKTSNIAHIGIDVEDMEASLKFYCDGLGMKKKFVLYYDELQTKKSLPWLIYLELAEHQYIELFYCYDGRKQHMNLRDYYSMHHMSCLLYTSRCV